LTGAQGLFVLGSLPGTQMGVRVDGLAPATSATLLSAAQTGPNATWTPSLTTNCPTGSFEYIDTDTTRPAKFYRVRQP
jgi:hypothetical protein